jgi:acetyltransferase-like isoleucine patch superfamily enzyme/acyl carrier protein
MRRGGLRPTLVALAKYWKSARGIARGRIELRGTRCGANVRSFGSLLVRGRAGVRVGARSVFLKGMFPSELECADGAELVIGPSSVFNYGITIAARRSVRIGARCRFGSLVHVRDDDGRVTAPVVIEDDVWIAHGAMIEPGAAVRRGSVVAAGAVVFGEVPANTLATGNPASCSPLPKGEGLVPAFSRREGGNGAHRSREQVRTAILEWLDDTRCFGEAKSLVTSDSMSLREAGLLDSLGLVQLLLMLEKRFAVSIDRELAVRGDRQNILALTELVVTS